MGDVEYLFIAIITTAATLLIGWRWASHRRQLIWGGIFGFPFGVLQIVLAGSPSNLGIGDLDAFGTFIALLLLGITFGALAVVGYELTINRWLTPSVHVARGQLKALVIGPLAGLILIGAGAPAILAGIFALFVNAAILTLKIKNAVIWDAIISAAGFGIWYAGLTAVLAVRAAGELGAWITAGSPLGLTLAGLPIEDVIFAFLFGAIIGPIFSATKEWRHPVRIRTATVPTSKLGVGLGIVLAAVAGFGWMTMTYVVPPRSVSVAPANTEEEVPTDTDIVFRFDQPVDRDRLRLTIEPPVEGGWVYEDATSTTHGFRLARFHPTVTLDPGTRYRVRLDGIASVWGMSVKPIDLTFSTRIVPDILALQADVADPQSVRATETLIIDPCEALLVTLSGPIDPAVTYQFAMEPSVALDTEPLEDDATFRLRPTSCLSTGTRYELRVTRQVVRRDRETDEIIAVDDPLTILETVVQTSGPAPTITSPQVLGIQTTALALTPVKNRKILPIALDFQDRALSCEAAALKMALAGKGVRVSERTIMKKIGYDPTPHKNGVWGNPDWRFVGNIDGRQNTTGYGVHWKPVARAARTWRRSYTFRNGTPEYLAQQIDRGNPVVIWGTLGRAWRDTWRTRDGHVIQAWKGEHARTVIGFYGPVATPTHFVINDPIVGRLVWTRTTLLNNWSRFNNSGVVVE